MAAKLCDYLRVTSVGIVGAGRAATLHAEAVRAASGVTLAGVTASSPASPRAAALAGALDCEVLPLSDLARRCDAVVIATPPASRAAAAAALSSSRRLRAVLVESPAATTLDGVTELSAALPGLPVMAAANLLHAPALRRMLDAVAAMDPHHLELRLAVPDPTRGPGAGRAFGGGVCVDPAAGFWPVVMAAMGEEVESVAVPRADIAEGLDRAAEVVLRSAGGRHARTRLSWGARVAEAALEAADSAHVARVEVWPVPVAEMDGEPVVSPAGSAHPLSALGFVAQIERLVRVAHGEARPWPGLDAASSSLTVAVAAAMSVRRGGAAVHVSEVRSDASPFKILSALPAREAERVGGIDTFD